jgi:hypothetical protein
MSKKASPALIGGFVIGAVALLVIAVLVFGSGRLFRDVTRHVVHFEGSIKGLRVGTSSTSKARSRACALGPTSTCAASASAR